MRTISVCLEGPGGGDAERGAGGRDVQHLGVGQGVLQAQPRAALLGRGDIATATQFKDIIPELGRERWQRRQDVGESEE